jgi:hypothetical protein
MNSHNTVDRPRFHADGPARRVAYFSGRAEEDNRR